MKEMLSKDDLVQLILTLAEDVIASKDQLTELDSAIGDGDLGVTMTLGFRAIQDALKESQDLDLQGVLSKCGMAFADHAASTFGALMSTMFSRAGRAVKGLENIGAAEAAAMLRSAVEGVQQRGKAAPGDKTVLDAMIPASQAFDQAASSGQSLPACLATALQAAQQGAEATIGMRSHAGRSGWLGERTVGVKDPGAAAFVIILESACKFVG